MNKKGFTLVEVIVVVAILAILAIIAVPNVVKMFNKSVEETMNISEREVLDAANLYRNDYCGRNAKSNENKLKCQNERKKVDESDTDEEYEVYFCLDTIVEADYISEPTLKGQTSCNGIVVYKYNLNTGGYQDGKTYLVCENDSYHTEGYEQYREQISSCGVSVDDNNTPTPSNPETPSNPSNPGTSTNPETPSNPENPTNPSNPETPSNPENPTTPTNPGGNTVVEQVSRIHFTDYYPYDVASSAEGILIESNGHYGLIDTSNPVSSPYTEWNYSTYNGKTLAKYIKDNYKNNDTPHLDFIIISHAHSDHTGGVPLLYEEGLINNKTVYLYKEFESNHSSEVGWNTKYYYDEALKAINNANAKKIVLNKHNNLSALNAKYVTTSNEITNYIEFDFYDLKIKIFNLKYIKNTIDNNNCSIVLISRGNQKMLLMSESNVTNHIEQTVGNYVGHVNMMKAGHYTAQNYLSLRLLNATTPNIMLLTGAKSGNTYSYGLATAIAYYKENGGIIIGNEDLSSPLVAKMDSNKITLYNNKNGNYSTVSSSQYLNANVPNGWHKISDTGGLDEPVWVYFENNKFVKGWKKVDGKWYYLKETSSSQISAGVMVTGWQEITYNGVKSWFYFNDKGAMQTGWQEITYNGVKSWYYFNDKGVMQTGWLKLNDKWYYLNSNGRMLTGTQTINGEVFVFDSNGVCIQGRGC